jgi:phosphoribosylaminoimidazole (AIR) synthetase
MPGTYQSGHFEVSGFVVGAVERTKYLPRTDEITPGDVVIGIPSSGVHSNGYSLVRAVVNRAQLSYESMSPFEPDKSLGWPAFQISSSINIECQRFVVNACDYFCKLVVYS